MGARRSRQQSFHGLDILISTHFTLPNLSYKARRQRAKVLCRFVLARDCLCFGSSLVTGIFISAEKGEEQGMIRLIEDTT
ncbi:MAG: hypothetical protein K6B74_13480 [Ruminococcus sp.]|nr:hypothetical protein [Ruminococcus sp.]